LEGVLPQKGPVTGAFVKDSLPLECDTASLGSLITIFPFLPLKMKTVLCFEWSVSCYH